MEGLCLAECRNDGREKGEYDNCLECDGFLVKVNFQKLKVPILCNLEFLEFRFF